MWGWQNPNQPGDPGQSTSGPPTAVHPHPAVVANAGGHGQPGGGHGQQPQGQELSDMLQMLDQGGGTSFEDLNIHMFNTPFE